MSGAKTSMAKGSSGQAADNMLGIFDGVSLFKQNKIENFNRSAAHGLL